MKILLENVRLAFPVLFKAKAIGDGDPSFSASFILPPDHPAVAKLNVAFDKLAKEEWKDKAPAIVKTLRAQDRLALHDGDLKAQYQGYEGNLFVSTRSKTRPSVFDRDKSPLVEESGKPYSGCYVNASIELWIQDNQKFGKRINAQLRGVQFVKDGDAFAAGGAASEEEFADLSESGDDSDDPTK
jgi:hypothetical protein